jgi:hypothetical protein
MLHQEKSEGREEAWVLWPIGRAGGALLNE